MIRVLKKEKEKRNFSLNKNKILIGFLIMFFGMILVVVNVEKVMGFESKVCPFPQGAVVNGKYYALGEGMEQQEVWDKNKLTSENIGQINNDADMKKVLKNKDAKDIVEEGLDSKDTAKQIAQKAGPDDMAKFFNENDYKINSLQDTQIGKVNNALHGFNEVGDANTFLKDLGVKSDNLLASGTDVSQYSFFHEGTITKFGIPGQTGASADVSLLVDAGWYYKDGQITAPTSPGGQAAPVQGSGCQAMGGGGGGSGGGDDKMSGEKILAAVQQVTGLASSALGSLKDALKKQPNAPTLFVPDGSVGSATVAAGESAILVDSRGNTMILNGEDTGNTLSWEGQGLKKTKLTNGNAVYVAYNSPIAKYDGTSTPTTIESDPSSGNPTSTASTATTSSTSSTTDSTSKLFLPLVSAASASMNTANDLGGQFISLVGYDAKMGGEKIGIFIFKPFDDINAKGAYLSIYDGESQIEFRNQKTLYSRQILANDFFINKISNEYDLKNSFILSPGGSQGNYLSDGKLRLTVGDAVVRNPFPGYEQLDIPNSRVEMWKKAAKNL